MLVLSNSAVNAPLKLGLESVHLLLDACPRLTLLGNLRTWAGIDYFNPESEKYFRDESDFSELKTGETYCPKRFFAGHSGKCFRNMQTAHRSIFLFGECAINSTLQRLYDRS